MSPVQKRRDARARPRLQLALYATGALVWIYDVARLVIAMRS